MTHGDGLSAMRATLAAAERFLASTTEAVYPDLPGPKMLLYTARYRAHLAAVVAASRGCGITVEATPMTGGRTVIAEWPRRESDR
jgi:hypothetical protein